MGYKLETSDMVGYLVHAFHSLMIILEVKKLFVYILGYLIYMVIIYYICNTYSIIGFEI